MSGFDESIIRSATSGTFIEFKNSLYHIRHWHNLDLSEVTLENVLVILRKRNTKESKLIQRFLVDLVIYMDGYWDYPGLLYWQGVDDSRSNYKLQVKRAFQHYRKAF